MQLVSTLYVLHGSVLSRERCKREVVCARSILVTGGGQFNVYDIDGEINQIDNEEKSPTTDKHTDVCDAVSIDAYNMTKDESDEIDII